MPTLKILNGVKIECYSADHPPPHIHASYSEYEDLIIIETGEIYVGDLPTKRRKIAQEYVKENTVILLKTFNLLNPQLLRDEKK